ncbi:prefoldin subunit [Colletotrichum asianum]
MFSSIRIADVLVLLLLSQATQAGPVRRAERLFGRGWNSTISVSVASSTPESTHLPTSAAAVTAKEEDDGSTPSPVFSTIDDTKSTSAATRGPSTTAVQSSSTAVFLPPPLSTISVPSTTSGGASTTTVATLPPMFSSIALPPYPTTGLRNGSALLPASSLTETPTGPTTTAAGEEGASRGPPNGMQSSLSFAFPVPGETTTTTVQPVVSSTSLVLSTTAKAEASSTPAPTSHDTPASSTTPLQTIPPSSATLKVTGSPNVGVPTIETSLPAATATISPEVAARNLVNAKSFNALFATLTEQSACSNGQVACVKGNIGKCGSDGAFDIVSCGNDQSCFALPMNTTEGVVVGCYNPTVASNILGEAVSAPGSSTSAAVSEVTMTVTPVVTATSTIQVTPPSSPETTSPAVPIATATSTVLVAPPEKTTSPGFTTTVVVTRTVEPDPAPTTTERESTTTAEEPTTLSTSTRRRTRSSTSVEISAPPAATTVTVTGTLTFDPIPSTVPTVLPTAPAAKDSPDAFGFVMTVTEKETVTATVTVKETETVTVTKGKSES